jgi:hypothetical protein
VFDEDGQGAESNVDARRSAPAQSNPHSSPPFTVRSSTPSSSCSRLLPRLPPHPTFLPSALSTHLLGCLTSCQTRALPLAVPHRECEVLSERREEGRGRREVDPFEHLVPKGSVNFLVSIRPTTKSTSSSNPFSSRILLPPTITFTLASIYPCHVTKFTVKFTISSPAYESTSPH